MQFHGQRNWKTKTVRDPIYGFIEIPEPLLSIVDHRLFQRLRWINQLPLEQLVYPSAQHSRFEHSLGTMWLALCTASYLYKNSKDRIDTLLEATTELNGLPFDEKLDQFFLAVGATGLLHDAGHAPFSHTLEEAYGYSTQQVHYDHEKIGYHVALKILEDLDLKNEPYARLLRKILDKSCKYEDGKLDDLSYIIRQLVDGPIDVDKGDYVIRDSYHCGVTYGVYDFDRLWMNLVLTGTPGHEGESVIAVLDKGAVEAWSLRIARFRMHSSVYKHKIRNITDALLIQVLAYAFQKSQKPEDLKKIVPVDLTEPLQIDQEVVDFTFWSDSNLVSLLYREFPYPYIAKRIEDYQKRSLGKLIIEVNLNDYPELAATAEQSKLKQVLMEKSIALNEERISFSSIIYKAVSAPVMESECQEKIRVVDSKDESGKMKKSRSLAEVLGFALEMDDSGGSSDRPKVLLQVFGDQNYSDRIKKVVAEELRSLSQL